MSPDLGGGSDSSSNKSRSKTLKSLMNQPKMLATIPSGRTMHSSSSLDTGKEEDSIFPDEPASTSTRQNHIFRKSTM